MLDHVIRASLQNRWAVLLAALILLVAGGALTLGFPWTSSRTSPLRR